MEVEDWIGLTVTWSLCGVVIWVAWKHPELLLVNVVALYYLGLLREKP